MMGQLIMQDHATWCQYYLGATPSPVELLDIKIISYEYHNRPHFAYPMSNGEIQRFDSIREWYDYVVTLRLEPKQVFLPYVDAFDEALRALFMAYVIPEFCKMGEMKVLATLEGALLAAYQHKMCTTRAGEHKCATLDAVLKWANKNDQLPVKWHQRDEQKASRNDLRVIRNKQMHGEMLEETLPWGGLFDVVKMTIEYAFRNYPLYNIHDARQVFVNSHREHDDWSGNAGNGDGGN